MNTLRQTCAASVLSLLLAVSALAGQIPSGGVVAPPPPPGVPQGPPAETQAAGDTQGPSLLETILVTIITWP